MSKKAPCAALRDWPGHIVTRFFVAMNTPAHYARDQNAEIRFFLFVLDAPAHYTRGKTRGIY